MDKDIDYYDLWTKSYEETFGKLFRVPPIGPTRMTFEKFLKSADSTMRFYGNWMDFYFKFYHPWLESIKKMSEKTAELMKDEVSLETYKKFYDMQMQVYEETFHEYLKSQDFASNLGKLVDSFMDFWKNYEEILEEQLKYMPIATKSEMDDLYKEVYSLKKKVKELSNQIKELSS
ncbi:MAG: poly(R)-hydroxyalkanoic acid synthase subunit PhaE [Methanosarcinales archaeon]